MAHFFGQCSQEYGDVFQSTLQLGKGVAPGRVHIQPEDQVSAPQSEYIEETVYLLTLTLRSLYSHTLSFAMHQPHLELVSQIVHLI